MATKKDVFRTKYEKLTGEQQNQMTSIKNRASALLAEFEQVNLSGLRSEKSRYVSLARTALEMAVMWAVKGLTLPEEEGEEETGVDRSP